MIFFGHSLDSFGVFEKIHSEIVSFLCGWSENRRFLCKFVAAMVRKSIVEIFIIAFAIYSEHSKLGSFINQLRISQ